ncbi:hypothetical protein [Sulfolobus islandicus rod-shaped virus 11]|uniref:Uncharacterized protein n=1 Tax=Sulfolobus islandicus rod-shaped virus 11 TaxID=1983546 RepID=A0A1X9SKD0_9VIRU|nr:hypothetical protein CCL47_gp01 [Sulfolobus islandicus rod-shaped virus 11]ARQ96680.1 hypothetical protein [Sulfolobus islandicus rod-shaped virus 11]
MAQEKSQNSFKEITQQEIKLVFSIQLEQVKGRHIEYNKLNIRINEISFTYLNPENIDFIKTLQKIAKLYQISQTVDNEKVIQGSKEEILKLIALLIYNLQ